MLDSVIVGGEMMNEIAHKGRHAFSHALPIAMPIGISFFFIGLGFGLYATSQGFPWWVPPAMAMTIFAGSMEFVVINLLLGGFYPINTFLLTLFVNGRHIFYGLSMLTKYTNMGWKWYPTVAWMCDESFAINATTKLPDDVDKKWFYFHVSWLNYMFWAVSTIVGGLFGNIMSSFDLRGVGFVLPALFIVIFLEMLLKANSPKIRVFGIAGAIVAIVMLLVTGKSLFMLASMCFMLIACYVAYKWGGVRFD